MKIPFCLCLILHISSTVNAKSRDYREASVYVTKDGEFHVAYDKFDTNATAYGYFKDGLNKTGWGVLEVKAGYGSHAEDDDLMYAAGILEGALTSKHIGTHYENLYSYFFSDSKPDTIEKLKDFFVQQQKWSLNMQKKLRKTDAFWRHASYVNSQMNGLYAGFKYASNASDLKPDIFVIQMLNAVGDLLDLRSALGDMRLPEFSKMSRDELLQYVNLMGQCSALVKVTGAFENVFMSHSSWFVYSATNRIYKHYHFNLADPETAAKSMSFSSYPGFLESLDDFYMLSSGLVMLQTTNNIFNTSLYEHVTPESMLAWQRVRIANFLARGGKQWYQNMARYNSGTYNNQYMIIDRRKVHLNSHIEDDALWVVEQVPTLVVGADQTAILRAGYWPSYNVPFYEAIYNLSGYPDFVAEHGLDFSYQMAPRAKIFRRDQASVTDMESMKHIMRYNDYKNDPYSEGQACNAICCRGDLNSAAPRASGCYDTKVTDMNMASSFAAYIINGPTLGDSLPPFAWSDVFANMSHVGLPEKYDFGWHYTQPAL